MTNCPSSQHARRKAAELLRSIPEGNLRRVESALAGGADIDGKGSDLPPLVLAAERGYVQMVELLLRKGANLNVTGKRYVACCFNDTCKKDRIVSGTTALHVAAQRGRLEVVRLLLRRGGNPNAVDSRGWSPLHLASSMPMGDAMNMATLLLEEAGADPLLAGTCGRVAVHFAAHQGHTDLLNLLLVKAPSALNMPSLQGYTPLCCAVMGGWECAVLHLLRLGAKQTMALDKRIPCPLMAAVDLNHTGVLRILLDHGNDVVGSAGCLARAVGSAVYKGRIKILAALLGYRIGGEATRQHLARWSQDGVPVLHFAVSLRQLASVSILLAAGADETALDTNGRCASEMADLGEDTDPAAEAAILQMLERGPAFRALSWRWRAGMGSSAGDAIRVTATGPRRRVGLLGLRIFRARSKKAFVRLASRFARCACQTNLHGAAELAPVGASIS